ncbi:bifunctional 23S rRNA (guanine(2069)-N(7))-methyltransferase RlmK/23S rRNA (guanine(2445)-N(2))-methyltransferase RlmL [Marinospirillum sp.]|uniref:bifunctional 23S rRNA (guanine(2069)-N(7))-methyltransferase RlmK/23S rRNA (guanine(2445)-N(2))-methyltransferase RlmL n=1 Tax=Marinospirillum sp. TaxID=2183934 RepID=UPI003A8B2444
MLDHLYTFHLSCSQGLEALLADEAKSLGFVEANPRVGRVTGQGTLEAAYRVLIWSRLASRLLLELDQATVTSAEDLAIWLKAIDWQDHLLAEGSFAVDVHGTTPALRHTHDTALRVKDAVVDYFRDLCGQRPNVIKERPDLRVHLRLDKNERATISLDLGGISLHQRGYRLQAGAAPLRENLAAGLLIRAGWPELAREGAAFIDPFCGSGTLLAEAGLMAWDIAPGLLRPWIGVETWLGHHASVWQDLMEEAEVRRAEAAWRRFDLRGRDQDPSAIATAQANLKRAGLAGLIEVEQGRAQDLPAPSATRGLVITNPPYGERLDELAGLASVYAAFGQRVQQHYAGWRLALFTNEKDLAYRIPAKPYKSYPLKNAALDCRLYLFELSGDTQRVVPARAAQEPVEGRSEEKAQTEALADQSAESQPVVAAPAWSEGAQMLANRLRKNLKKYARWLKREQVSCYRLYDADLPEYALAIDLYTDAKTGQQQVHVQEYAPPASIPENKARQRLMEALIVLPEVLQVPAQALHLKQRQRQAGKRQYQKQGEAGAFFTVREGAALLEVNLSDYLDTGLFLDHRPIRRRLYQETQGLRFLNLFCYTGVATVQAALGGALHTTSVDLSRTYLSWLERNLALNKQESKKHFLVQADCRAWLAQQAQERRLSYDLIFMDPPTFSNSKRMQGTLDIQRDQEELVHHAMSLLTSDGVLIFSNNLRGFKISPALLEAYEVQDISRATLDPDFERRPKIHQCFEIRHPVAE